MIAAALVIVAEMFNTAIEAAIDVATTSFDPRAKMAKDVAAGAVLVCAFVAVGVGLHGLRRPALVAHVDDARAGCASRRVHLTVIALVLVVLIVIAVKAATGRGTPRARRPAERPRGHRLRRLGRRAVHHRRLAPQRAGRARSRW